MQKAKMSYDLVYQVYQRERQSALLSKVEKDFYEDVATLIRELNNEYEAENGKGPTSTKTMVLHDELKKLRTLIREIYEYRIRKITLLALTAAHEGTVDTKHLVGKELIIFEQLSGILQKNHEEIVKVEHGIFTISSDDAGADTGVKVEGNMVEKVSDVKTKATEKGTTVEEKEVEAVAAKKKERAEEKRVRPRTRKLIAVQILEDLPKFMGEGGEVYILKKKDYASLPQAMAERLEKEGKARIVPS